MEMTRGSFFRVAGSAIVSVPALLGLTQTGRKTGFETSAPVGHHQVQLVQDYIPDGMRYQEVREWPYYNMHPFRELEWWIGSSRRLVDDFNKLGWRFTHLPDDEIALSLWEYSECQAEGISTTILLAPSADLVDCPDSAIPSVVWEVRSVQCGSGIHGCNPWDAVFGDLGKVVEWAGGCATTEPATLRFTAADPVTALALWLVAWLNVSVQAGSSRDFHPNIRDGVSLP